MKATSDEQKEDERAQVGRVEAEDAARQDVRGEKTENAED